jgi:hypothetical protein
LVDIDLPAAHKERKNKMARTITDNGKQYQVYSERQLEQAKAAKAQGERVYIVRSCGECGAQLYGSNLVVMRNPPVCATHDMAAKR